LVLATQKRGKERPYHHGHRGRRPRNNARDSGKIELIHTSKNRLFDIIGYRINPTSFPQKYSKSTSFVTLFQPRSKGAAGKKNCKQFILNSNLLSIFLQISGYKSGLAVENPQNTV